MKKLALVLFMVLALSGTAFAESWHDQYNYYDNTYNTTNQGGQGGQGGAGGNAYSKSKSSATATGGTATATGGSATVKDVGNVTIGGGILSKTLSPEASVGDITNISKPVQVFDPTITFNAPKIPNTVAVGSAPNMTDSELNFISPNERDVQTELPKFGCDTVKPIKVSDCMIEVIWQSNDIKFKDLYTEVLKGLRSKEVQQYRAKAVRYQIREAASAKTWTSGGEVAANAVGMIGSAASGVTGGLIPKVGRSKSSNLYTVLFILVQEFK